MERKRKNFFSKGKTINRLIKQSLLFAAVPILLSCSISNQIDASFTRPGDDFARSEIINSGPGIADGSSELLIVIQLLNSNGSPIKLFRPTYEVSFGSGVTTSVCTLSNDNGISTCILKATHAGTKRILVTNVKISLAADVVFNNPTDVKTLLGFVGDSKIKTQGTYVLNGVVGTPEVSPVKTSGTYTLYGGVQGEGFSR